jgi:histidine ammonia-lyase
VRLMRQRGLDGQFSGAVGEALALTDILPRDTEDRDLRGDIVSAESLLDDIGRLVPPDARP